MRARSKKDGGHVDRPVIQRPEHPLLTWQRMVGNQVVSRLVPYNDRSAGTDFIDPEQATGALPFRPDGSWDAVAINRRMSQYQPGPSPNEDDRCVEASFLAVTVLRGPAAVLRLIGHYTSRYRATLRQTGLTPARRRRVTDALATLAGVVDRVQDRTATFADLSLLQSELFMVLGHGPTQGTDNPNSAEIARREGYRVQWINTPVHRGVAARWAAGLRPGEFIDCGVDPSAAGTGTDVHSVHLGRTPDGRLYLYNPLPVAGDQMVFVSDDLHEVDGYFVNRRAVGGPVVPASGAVGAPATAGRVTAERTFRLMAKYSPPVTP